MGNWKAWMSDAAINCEGEEPLSPSAKTLLHGHQLKIKCHIMTILNFGFGGNLNN